MASGATLNITNNALVNERDGLEVSVTGTGDSTLTHNGSGTITVHGGNAIWVKAATGTATATVGSVVKLVVDNTDPTSQESGTIHAGIHTRAASGATNIDSGATITTTGGLAYGIYAEGGDGVVNVKNTGTINVGSAGDTYYSVGISAISSNNVTVTGTGNITANGNPSVTNLVGDSTPSHAIFANSSDGTTTVEYSGNLISHGEGGAGIRANSGGVATVVNYTGSRIEAFDDNGDGIYASNTSDTGTVSITATGTIITHSNAAGGGTGSSSFGLVGTSAGGDVKVTFTGDLIDVSGTGAGILATSSYGGGTGLGTVTVNNDGNIIARSDNEQGIHTQSSTGTQTITNTGDIKTLGTVGAHGIWANPTGAATVRIDNNGDISTVGAASNGINVSGGGKITIDNSGDITATGDNGRGINAISTADGDVTVTHAAGATITTSGNGSGGTNGVSLGSAAGIFAYSAAGTTGNVQVNAAGDITTYGDNRANGIFAQNRGTGNATVIASGDIATTGTTGPYSYGISANIYGDGNAVIQYTNADGTVSTKANDSAALYAYIDPTATVGGNVTVQNAGTLTTEGDGVSHGIWARVGVGSGTAKVTNSGEIKTSGDNASGVVSQSLDGAQTLINSGDITTSGASANAIDARTTDAGSVTINNTGAIAATGTDSYGIYARTAGDTGTGNIDITSKADIVSANSGIFGTAVDKGHVAITASGDITLNGNMTNQSTPTRAVGAYATGDSNTNDWASVHYLSGTVDYTGSNVVNGLYASSKSSDATVISDAGTALSTTSHTIFARTGGTAGATYTTNEAGNATVVFNGESLESTMNDASAIWAGAVGVRIGGDTGTSNVSVANDHGMITTHGDGSAGIHGRAQEGDVLIVNGGAITTEGGTASNFAYTDRAAGVYGWADAGTITITNTGAISTQGDGSSGILAYAPSVNGDILVTNSGAVTTANDNASGIEAVSAGGDVTVANSAVIITGTGGMGTSSHAISATTSDAGNVLVKNSVALVTNGPDDAAAIVAAATGTGNATVETSGVDITTNGLGTDNHGVEARADGGAATIDYAGGTISVAGASSGLKAWNDDSGNASTATVSLSSAIIDGTRTYSQNAVQATAQTSGSVTIGGGSEVHAGWMNGGVAAVGVATGGETQTILNQGIIDSLSDAAIRMDSNDVGGTATLTNDNLIEGTVGAKTSVVTFTNNGLWNMRNFADTDGDGVRDHSAVAVSDFGTSGSNTIVNNGTVALLGHSEQAITLDTTGEYLPLGLAANHMTLASPTQAHLYGVSSFTNNGIIDMQANPSIGDVIVITGGQTAGANGGGVFVTGGMLKLDTYLNEGGRASTSDVLVVDSTQIGSGATLLDLKLSGHGARTPNDGILLVEVTNKAASVEDAFIMDKPRIRQGIYQYMLFHGGNAATGGNAQDGNWYLRADYSDEAVMYTVLPSLAADLGAAMMGGMSDRGGDDSADAQESGDGYEDRTVWCKDPRKKFRCLVRVPVKTATRPATRYNGAWARVFGIHGERDARSFDKSGANYDYDMEGLQVGFDIYGANHDDGSRDRAGVYAGAARTFADIKSLMGGQAGKAKMDAYSVGAYWTHFGAGGWYLDGLVQGTRYTSDTASKWGVKSDQEGYGVGASLEAGYNFRLGYGFLLQPQAQLMYQHISLNAYHDDMLRVVPTDTDDVRGRLGAKLGYGWQMDLNGKARPFTLWGRASLWHKFDVDSKTDFYDLATGGYLDSITTPMKGTWVELGLEARGQVADNLAVFTNGSYNTSVDGRGMTSWGGMAGVKLTW